MGKNYLKKGFDGSIQWNGVNIEKIKMYFDEVSQDGDILIIGEHRITLFSFITPFVSHLQITKSKHDDRIPGTYIQGAYETTSKKVRRVARDIIKERTGCSDKDLDKLGIFDWILIETDPGIRAETLRRDWENEKDEWWLLPIERDLKNPSRVSHHKFEWVEPCVFTLKREYLTNKSILPETFIFHHEHNGNEDILIKKEGNAYEGSKYKVTIV